MGQGARLLGLLYVETEEDRFHDRRDMEALAQFCGIAGLALGDPKEPLPSRGVESYLERTPADEVEREQLLVLLERNEWNIARVSRLLGITRPTVYKRLQRFGIERRRVPKTLARRQLAASRPS
jgi:DNA-binding NtrC family response regulator